MRDFNKSTLVVIRPTQWRLAAVLAAQDVDNDCDLNEHIKEEIRAACAAGNPVLFLYSENCTENRELEALVPGFSPNKNLVFYQTGNGVDQVITRCRENGYNEETFRVCGAYADKEVLDFVKGITQSHNRRVLLVKRACGLHYWSTPKGWNNELFRDIPGLIIVIPDKEAEVIEQQVLTQV